MKLSKLYVVPFVLTIGVCAMQPIKTEAANMDFSVKAVLPENQITKDVSYLDLRVKPEQKQTVYFELKNTSAEPITVDMFISSAITNSNGVIDYPNPSSKTYDGKSIEYDKSLKYPLHNIAKLTDGNEVKLEGREEKKVPVEITVPKEPFDGIIVGGITFEQRSKDEETDNKDNKGSMGVKNKFNYRIGIKLSENDKTVIPDLKLLSVKPGLTNYRNAVIVRMQNPTGAVIDKFKVDAKILKGSKEMVNVKKEEMRVAPNSYIDFPVELKNQAFEPGKYKAVVEATDVLGQKWNFEKEFTIEKNKAEELNKESVTDVEPKKDNTLLYIIIGALVFILLIIIIVLITRSRKHKKQLEAELEKAKTEAKREKQKEKIKNSISKDQLKDLKEQVINKDSKSKSKSKSSKSK